MMIQLTIYISKGLYTVSFGLNFYLKQEGIIEAIAKGC